MAALLLFAGTALAAAPEEPGGPPVPDFLFFAERVALDLHFRCASCHAYSETAGAFVIAAYADVNRPDPEKLLANYRATLRFLDPADPGRSPLLEKAFGRKSHGGGEVLARRDAREARALVDFALGATTRNLPPDAVAPPPAAGRVGETVEVDATLSSDRDHGPVGFRWRLLDRPDGSRPVVEGMKEPVLRLRADRPGAYRFELRVHDGALWSLPEETVVLAGGDVARAPGAEARRPEVSALPEGRLDAARTRLVRRLFVDLKQRTPTVAEQARGYALPVSDLVDALLADSETWEAWYERQLHYFLLLDRFRPAEGPLTTLPDRLARGETAPLAALEEIVRSQFFNQRNPGNDTFVTVVLEQCLGMVVQKNPSELQAGKRLYDGHRAKFLGDTGDSQADVVRIVFRRPECAEHFVRRTYRDLFDEEPPPARLAADAARVRAAPGGFRETLRGWLLSPEYAAATARARTKPEVPYVRSLFQDVLGRLPSYEELRNVRNAFLSLADPTPIRLVMARVLLDARDAVVPRADDPERFVREQFVRLFARLPSDAEREAFVGAVRADPRRGPRLVLWTLLSSAEYQTY